MRFIFDLDHTVIDSSHRAATRADGSLDLDHWRENSTPEMIAKDSLLPLADQWRKVRAKGSEIIVCTARVMGLADYEFLGANGLLADAVLSRKEGDDSKDHDLKLRLLFNYAQERGLNFRRFKMFSVMFDDNKNVINHLTANGFKVYDAIQINKQLKAA